MQEEWEAIEGFAGYEVSNCGKVRSYFKRGERGGTRWHISDMPQRILKPSCDPRGYLGVTLCANGEKYRKRIAALVALAFLGPCPAGQEICHSDGDKQNNCQENLRYDTRVGNLADIRGKVGQRKLAADDVIELRNLALRGVPDDDLAKAFNVGVATARNCRTGYTYKHIGGPMYKKSVTGKPRLTDAEVRVIRRMGVEHSLSRLAELFGVSISCISLILRGLRRQKAGGPISES